MRWWASADRDGPCPLWQEAIPIAALFVDLLPAWRVQGGMGATHLVEGFARTEVSAHMDLIGYTPPERREAWDYLADMEREYRDIRAAAERKENSGEDRRIIRDI